LVLSGTLLFDEARAMLGLPPLPNGEGQGRLIPVNESLQDCKKSKQCSQEVTTTMELKDINSGSIDNINDKELLSLNHRLHQLFATIEI